MPDSADTADTADPTKHRLQIISVSALKRLAVLFSVVGLGLIVSWWQLINMPGRSHAGPLPALTTLQQETANQLRADTELLAGEFAQRHVHNPIRYAATAKFLADRLTESGLTPAREDFHTQSGQHLCTNITAEITGTSRPEEIIIIGAHYDSYMGMPGADDNASGVACLLALAGRLAGAGEPHDRTIRFVLFANEEPPHFMTEDMGSHVHAFAANDRDEDIRLMLSLEMLGYFDTAPGSQRYPKPLSAFYPDTADFIAVVGNVSSRPHVRRLVKNWRNTTPFPCVGAALPAGIPGVGFSDQWSFWQAGYPAVMITDTSFYRNDNYHTSRDTPDTLDYERMARVADGLESLIRQELDSGS